METGRSDNLDNLKFTIRWDGAAHSELPSDPMSWDDAVREASRAQESNPGTKIKIVRIEDGRHMATVYGGSGGRGKPRVYRRSG